MSKHRISCENFLSGENAELAMINESKAINYVQCELSVPQTECHALKISGIYSKPSFPELTLSFTIDQRGLKIQTETQFALTSLVNKLFSFSVPQTAIQAKLKF